MTWRKRRGWIRQTTVAKSGVGNLCSKGEELGQAVEIRRLELSWEEAWERETRGKRVRWPYGSYARKPGRDDPRKLGAMSILAACLFSVLRKPRATLIQDASRFVPNASCVPVSARILRGSAQRRPSTPGLYPRAFGMIERTV